MNNPFDQHFNLPPGVTPADVDDPEPVDEDGLTYREQCKEEIAEHEGDCERNERTT